jgi:hypothetical protein
VVDVWDALTSDAPTGRPGHPTVPCATWRPRGAATSTRTAWTRSWRSWPNKATTRAPSPATPPLPAPPPRPATTGRRPQLVRRCS